MYLWKCWREYRKITLLLMIMAAVFTWIIDASMKNAVFMTVDQSFDTQHAKYLSELAPVHAAMIVLMGIFAGCLVSGGGGLGREYETRTAEYLFVRPVRRRELVWSNWACGLVAMLCVMAVPLVSYYTVYLYNCHQLGTWKLFHSVAWILPIGLLLFGLAQLCGVLIKGASKGAAISFAAVGLFLAATVVRAHYHLHVPSWMDYYGYPQQSADGNGHWLNCLVWLAIALVFPVVTQRLLEKRDI